VIAVKRPTDNPGSKPEPRPDNRPKLVKFDMSRIIKRKKREGKK
jgi:hypothetical protein